MANYNFYRMHPGRELLIGRYLVVQRMVVRKKEKG